MASHQSPRAVIVIHYGRLRNLLFLLLVGLCLSSAPSWAIPPTPHLEVVEYAPEGANTDSPIVVALHGYGDTADAFMRFARPLVPGFRVLSVRAPLAHPKRGGSWYRIGTQAAATDISESASRVIKWLRTLDSKYKNTHRPILIGFSQGAVISLSVARKSPELVRGVLAIGGYVEEAAVVSGHKSTKARPHLLLVHGRQDRVVPYARALSTKHAFAEKQYPVTMLSHDNGHAPPRAKFDIIQEWLAERLLTRE